MKLNFNQNKIEIDKDLNELDKFVIDFTSILNKNGIKYVVVSGYVAILFGRSRGSEDIDIIAEKIDFKKFLSFWNDIYESMECIITEDAKSAYKDYLLQNNAVRFSYKGKFIPNVEIKFPKNELDEWSTSNRKEVILNGNRFFTSPLELQIPYKLFLGSEKDIEDAKHLYNLFKGKLDLNLLEAFNRKLNITKMFYKYLK